MQRQKKDKAPTFWGTNNLELVRDSCRSIMLRRNRTAVPFLRQNQLFFPSSCPQNWSPVLKGLRNSEILIFLEPFLKKIVLSTSSHYFTLKLVYYTQDNFNMDPTIHLGLQPGFGGHHLEYLVLVPH